MIEWIEGSCEVAWKEWGLDSYAYVSCEVKVGEEHSKPFRVACGLRQGCSLSPLLYTVQVAIYHGNVK